MQPKIKYSEFCALYATFRKPENYFFVLIHLYKVNCFNLLQKFKKPRILTEYLQKKEMSFGCNYSRF